MPAGPVGSAWATGTWSVTSWMADVWANLGAALDFVLDVNTRVAVYLRDAYTMPGGDLTTLATYKMLTYTTTPEATARFKKLIQDATDATQ